jgi:phage-related protein
MSDFNYVPSYTTGGSDKYAELESRFGDGYVQSIPDGINPVAETINLVFDPIVDADIEAIRAFFRGKAGQTFTWTNPKTAVEKRYRRKGEVNFTYGGLAGTLNVSIEESHGT